MISIPSIWIAGILVLVLILTTLLWRNRKVLATECGHRTNIRGVTTVLGEKVSFRLPLQHGKTAYCSDCLAKMAIRCAWCGGSILVGKPVTLYATRDENWAAPDYAVPYQEDANDEYGRYLGCLRHQCAESAGDRAGFWVPPGRVYRVPTAWEMSMADLAQGGNGVVIINDLSRP